MPASLACPRSQWQTRASTLVRMDNTVSPPSVLPPTTGTPLLPHTGGRLTPHLVMKQLPCLLLYMSILGPLQSGMGWVDVTFCCPIQHKRFDFPAPPSSLPFSPLFFFPSPPPHPPPSPYLKLSLPYPTPFVIPPSPTSPNSLPLTPPPPSLSLPCSPRPSTLPSALFISKPLADSCRRLYVGACITRGKDVHLHFSN